MASQGSKVLQIRSVEFAMKFGVKVHVRSSLNRNEGTWIVPEESNMESVVVAGVALVLASYSAHNHGGRG